MSATAQRASVRKPPPRAPEWAHEAYKLVQAGAGIKSAAKEVGRSRDAIRYWLQPARREQGRARMIRYNARRAADPATRRCGCGRVLSSGNHGGVCQTCLWGDPAKRAENDTKLVRMWRANASAREIANALGKSEGYVVGRAAQLRARGSALPLRDGGRVVKYDRTRLLELWNSGTPSRTIAAELGMNTELVPVIVGGLRKQGWPLERRFRSEREWVELAPRIERMWADGVNRTEMGRRLAVSTQRLDQVISLLRDRGYRLPRRVRSEREWLELAPRIERMWADGVNRTEMGRRLAVSTSRLSQVISLLRDRGYRLPRRRLELLPKRGSAEPAVNPITRQPRKGGAMAKPIVSDELWEEIEPLIPEVKRRRRYPGHKRIPDREVLTGILFVLITGIPWERLPQEMGCGSGMTCWRRLHEWQEQGVWAKLHEVLLGRLNGAGEIDWQRAAINSSHLRAFGGASARARAQ